MLQEKVHLRCSLLNAQGLVTKRTNKLQSEEFQQIFNSSDVVLLVETWTNELSNIDVSNFQAFVLNRNENKKSSKRSSGGIIFYFILYSETQCISKLDKIGIFIDMKFH